MRFFRNSTDLGSALFLQNTSPFLQNGFFYENHAALATLQIYNSINWNNGAGTDSPIGSGLWLYQHRPH